MCLESNAIYSFIKELSWILFLSKSVPCGRLDNAFFIMFTCKSSSQVRYGLHRFGQNGILLSHFENTKEPQWAKFNLHDECWCKRNLFFTRAFLTTKAVMTWSVPLLKLKTNLIAFIFCFYSLLVFNIL